MRIRCRLKEYRGKRSLRELELECGVSNGVLSMLEHGRLLPLDRQIEALEAAYGHPFEEWYTTDGDGLYGARVMLVLAPDEASG